MLYDKKYGFCGKYFVTKFIGFVKNTGFYGKHPANARRLQNKDGVNCV